MLMENLTVKRQQLFLMVCIDIDESASIKHRAVRFARSMGFSTMADRLV